ncbi:MAG TPA: Gfo/Idh/MocA family oxidoreductase [Acidimicrobiales bacterium]|nr:Gfo/Idh/MocA family oxidoreductase [Acidimicrobiales bacterium]
MTASEAAAAVPPVGMGVIGATSSIANGAVLPALAASPATRLVSVASRDPLAGDEVAARFGAERSAPDYDAVLADPDVEAVYVPLPNGLHREWTERAAAAGRHVLCEKPLAPSAGDARAMAEACGAAGVVLMEAYMTPFHPRAPLVGDLVGRGVLGRPRFARAEFGFPLGDVSNHRWRPEMGGGALLDVGVYCLSPLLEIGGEPRAMAARAVTATSGVDATFSGWLAFPDGFTATFACSFEAPERQLLEVTGTAAAVRVDWPFAGGPAGTRPRLVHLDGREEEVTGPDGDPYRRMVEHFAAAVRGRTALSRPPAASVALLDLLDRLRAAADT